MGKKYKGVTAAGEVVIGAAFSEYISEWKSLEHYIVTDVGEKKYVLSSSLERLVPGLEDSEDGREDDKISRGESWAG